MAQPNYYSGEQIITLSPDNGFSYVFYTVGSERFDGVYEKTSGDLETAIYNVRLKTPIEVTKERAGNKYRIELHFKVPGMKEEVRYLGDFAFTPDVRILPGTENSEINDMLAYYPTVKIKVTPDTGSFIGDILYSYQTNGEVLNLSQFYGVTISKIAAESTSEYGVYQITTSMPIENSKLGLSVSSTKSLYEEFTLTHSSFYSTIKIPHISTWTGISMSMLDTTQNVEINSLSAFTPSFRVQFTPDKGIPSKVKYKVGSSNTEHELAFTQTKESSGVYRVTASSAIPESVLTSEGGLNASSNGSTTVIFYVSNSKDPNYFFPSAATVNMNYIVPTRASITPTAGVTYTNGFANVPEEKRNEYAKLISNNSEITNTTMAVYVDDGTNHYKISVGDIIRIRIYNYNYDVAIMGFNHYSLTDPNAYGEATVTGKAGILLGTAYNPIETKKQMDSTQSRVYSWQSADLRSWCNSGLKNNIYSGISNIIKTVKRSVRWYYDLDSKYVVCDDTVFIASIFELSIMGNPPASQQPYAYYKAGNSAIKSFEVGDISITDYWATPVNGPTPITGNDFSEAYVVSKTASNIYWDDFPTNKHGVAPCWCI